MDHMNLAAVFLHVTKHFLPALSDLNKRCILKHIKPVETNTKKLLQLVRYVVLIVPDLQ